MDEQTHGINLRRLIPGLDLQPHAAVQSENIAEVEKKPRGPTGRFIVLTMSFK